MRIAIPAAITDRKRMTQRAADSVRLRLRAPTTAKSGPHRVQPTTYSHQASGPHRPQGPSTRRSPSPAPQCQLCPELTSAPLTMPRKKPAEGSRQRKEKFSDEELRVFGEQLQVHGEVLFLTAKSTLAQKTLAWAAMTDAINAVSGTKRTVYDVKKRWQDIKGKVRRDLDAHRRQLATTGGGPTQEPTWQPWEEIAMVYMDEETLHGVGPVDHGDSDTGDDDQPSTSRCASGHSRPRKRQPEDDGDVVVVTTPPPPPPPPQQQPTPAAAAQPVVRTTAASPGPAGAPDDDVILIMEPVQQRPTLEGTIRAIQVLIKECASPAQQGEPTEEGTQGTPEVAEGDRGEEADVVHGDVRLHSPEPAAAPEPQSSPVRIRAPTPVPPHAPPPVPSEAPLLAPAGPRLRRTTPTPPDWEGSDLGGFSDPSPDDRLSPRWVAANAARHPPAADPALRLAITDMTRRLCAMEQQMGVLFQASEARAACSLRTAVAAEGLAAGDGSRCCAEALEGVSRRLDTIAANQVAIARRQRNLTRQCARACTEMGNRFLTLSDRCTAMGDRFLGLTGQMADSMRAMVDLATAMSSRPAAAPLSPVRVPSSSASAEASTSEASNPPSQASSPGTGASRRSTRSGAHLPHTTPPSAKRGRK